jgi:hypothetical protein
VLLLAALPPPPQAVITLDRIRAGANRQAD